MTEETQQDACLLAYQRWQAHNPKELIFPTSLNCPHRLLESPSELSMKLLEAETQKKYKEHLPRNECSQQKRQETFLEFLEKVKQQIRNS